jgi:hypothetical protein
MADKKKNTHMGRGVKDRMLGHALKQPGADRDERHWDASARQLIEVLLMGRETEKPQSWRCQADGWCETTCGPDAETEG